jgi:uncharacterized surface protein with fasciclin (FAS1) repeats/plastocyanin
MKFFIACCSFLSLLLSSPVVEAQCEADVTIYLTDFMFTPNAVTIEIGQTVAFVNAEGIHNVDGTAPNNPGSFFLDETQGDIQGVCMGTVTFDVPGTYTFESSVGVQPELGMTGTIVVDAVTLSDQLAALTQGDGPEGVEAWQSGWAFNSYFSSTFAGQPNGSWTGDVDLNGNEPLTVFVPTDAAIESLMERFNLSQFDMLAFVDMVPALKYHIVPGLYLAEDLNNGLTLPTTEGSSLTITTNDSGAPLIDESWVIASDILAYNGVIHIIDQVLAPAGYPAPTTWDIIANSPNHTILTQALINEGLVETLRGQPILNDNEPAEGPFTVFAPTDDAWFAFVETNGFESVNDLLTSQFIDDILLSHLVEAPYEAADLFNGQGLVTYNNQVVTITSSSGELEVNTAPITQPDLLAYNGVVHVLGEVMPFNFPPAEGTCGAWTFNMTAGGAQNNGWEGAALHVFSDGALIASETMTSGGSASFSVPVDSGSRIDVVYTRGNSVGSSHSFSVLNANNELIYSSNGSISTNTPPSSVYGLKPCGDAPTCGLIEIEFTDNSGDGWYGGGMSVYSGPNLEANIFFNPDFDGDGFADEGYFSLRSVYVTVDEGEIDFLVNAPLLFPASCGYAVKNPEGDVVLEVTNLASGSPSTLNFEICASTPSGMDVPEASDLAISLYPNPSAGNPRWEGLAPDSKWQATLTNTAGQIVLEQRGVGNQELNVQELPAGLYNVQIQLSNSRHHNLRFVHE